MKYKPVILFINQFYIHCCLFSVSWLGKNVPKTPKNPPDSPTTLQNTLTVYFHLPIIVASICDVGNFPFNFRSIFGGNTPIRNYPVEMSYRRGTTERSERTYITSKRPTLVNRKLVTVNLRAIAVMIASIDWYLPNAQPAIAA